MIKHVSFDLWGTLITSNPHYRSIRKRLLSEVFEVHVSQDECSAGKISVDLVSELSGIQLNYAQTVALSLGKAAQKINKDQFLQNVERFRVLNAECVELYHPKLITPDAVKVLSTLKERGYSMNVLSNTSIIPGFVLRNVLKILDIDKYFTHMFFSDEYEMAKPNPNFYRRIELECGVPLNTVLHVGDNAYTDSGAGLTESYILSKSKSLYGILAYLENEV